MKAWIEKSWPCRFHRSPRTYKIEVITCMLQMFTLTDIPVQNCAVQKITEQMVYSTVPVGNNAHEDTTFISAECH